MDQGPYTQGQSRDGYDECGEPSPLYLKCGKGGLEERCPLTLRLKQMRRLSFEALGCAQKSLGQF